MAFNAIKHSKGHGPQKRNDVRVSVSKSGNAILRIPQSIARPLNISVGGCVQLLIGEGVDAGKIALRSAEDGYSVCAQSQSPGGALQVTVSAKRLGWPNDYHSTVSMGHEVEDDMIVLSVPNSVSGPEDHAVERSAA